MKKGFGVLALIGTLALARFVGPSAPQFDPLLQSATQHADSPVELPLVDIQGKAVQSLESCAADQDPLCRNCSSIFCPTSELSRMVREFFSSWNKESIEDVDLQTACSQLPSAPLQAQGNPQATKSSLDWGIPAVVRGKIRFVVAIVPDPAHTHMGLFFDRQIDALGQAAQEDGYYFARANMPWDSRGHPETSDPRLALLWRDFAKNRDNVPGLMIFRKAGPKFVCDALAPLFVFVVGETPTDGLNKRQFFNALQLMQSIQGTPRSPKALYIQGPTFSGSLYSLMFVLRQIPKGLFPHTVIHSGTVNSAGTIQWFTQDFKQLREDRPDTKRPAFTFRTFQESDCYVLSQFAALVRTEIHSDEEIALLSEDDTAYGEQPCGHNLVHLYFPREISGLRSAFQRDVQSEEPLGNGSRRPPRSTLRSNLEDNGNDDDSIPSYSRTQSALSQEAVLMGIVSNLQKHHSQFVVIRATNPLDSLFLSRYLRTAYPEGRIVTMSADLRFQREMSDISLRGILALTSYSLRPGSDDGLATPQQSCQSGVQRCDHVDHVDHVFPSSESEGTYNAMLSLLKCDPTDSQNQGLSPGTVPTSTSPLCIKLPIAHYAGYGWPNFARNSLPTAESPLKPPLWLIALGRNGYWPLSLLSGPAHGDVRSVLAPIDAPADSRIEQKRAPLPWKTLFWLGIAIATVLLYLIWKGSLLGVSDTSANLAPFNVPSRNLVFFLIYLLLLLMLLPLSWPWIHWYYSFSPKSWFYLIILAILCVIGIGFKDLRRRGTKKLAYSFLLFSLIACFISTHLALSSVPAPAEDFLLYRYVHITSGLSPVVPLLLLLAAGLWCAWHTLVGLALLDKRKPLLPTKEKLRPHGESQDNHLLAQSVLLDELSWESNRLLTKVMQPNSWDLRLYVPPALFLLLAGTAIEAFHPVKSLEGWPYDVAYGWLLGLIIFVLLLGLTRLAVIWLEFRNLLGRLDQFPLRRSFERLEGFSWTPIWKLGDSALRGADRLTRRQFETLDHLWNRGIDDEKLKYAVEAARKTRDEVEARLGQRIQQGKNQRNERAQKHSGIVNFFVDLAEPQPQWVQEWVHDISNLQCRLAATCGVALNYLVKVWDQEKQPIHSEISLANNPIEVARRRCTQSTETQLTEKFVCLFYLNFILSAIFRMRTLVVSAGGMFVLALFSFNSYPFEPRGAFHTLMVILFLLVIGVVAIVLAEMHRNATLSRITDKIPGELGIDFWFRLASFVAIPLISVLAVQFPEINNFLFSWLEPTLQALK